MSNLGTMTAKLAIDFRDGLRDLRNAKNELGGWQSYSASIQSRNGNGAGGGGGTPMIVAARNAGASNGGLIRSTLSLLGTIGKIGITAGTAYGSWRLHAARMKNELLTNQILMNQLGKGPAGGGTGTTTWLAQMRGGLVSNRTGLSGLLRNTLLVGGAIAGLGAAAVYGYGMWKKQSASIRTDLMQQKVLTEQLRQMRGGVTGGIAGGRGGPGVGTIGLGVLAGGIMGRATSALASVPGISLKLASDAEQAQIAFEVMLGSADKAKGMLGELKAYADKSPFDIAGTNAAAQKLLNYSMQAQDVLPSIRMLGDVAAGDKEKFDRLSTAFGQTTSTGRLMGQDLLQFINAGFNPLQEISKKTGESMASLKKRMEDGGISALEVRDAFVAATSQGGRFYNMTARQSQTVAGKFSTMKDAASGALRQLGENMMTSLDVKGWLDYVTAGLNQIPWLFQNAGTLLHAEVLNWNIYLMELIPEASTTINDIGIIFTAGWDAIGGSYHLFLASVKAGFEEIVNLARAAGAALQAAADHSNKGGWVGWAETLADNASWGMYGKTTGRKTGLSAGLETFQSTFAAQPDAMKPGTDFASTFGKRFTESVAKQVSGENGGISTADDLKKKRDDVLSKLTKPDALKPPEIKYDGKPGASFNSSTADGKDKSGKDASAKSTAALRGSQDAARIFTSGVGGVQTKQLSVLQSIDKTLKGKGTGAKKSPKYDIEETDL